MNAAARAIDYEGVAGAYRHALLNVLRGHSAGEDYLELWVPDEDPVKSILNMIEAAQLAGRDAIAVEVSTRTMSLEQARRLQALAQACGEAAVTPTAAGYRFDVSKLQTARHAAAAKDDTGPIEIAHAPATAPTDKYERESHRRSDVGDVDILPVLANGLTADLHAGSHEGFATTRAGHIVVTGASSFGQIAVLADPRTHVIAVARHHGIATPVGRAVADLLCRLIEGRTVQDASDHGAIAAIHTLYDQASRPQVSGILLPSNCGRVFVELVALLHCLRADYADLTGLRATANTFDAAPSPRWPALSADERLAEIELALRDFCANHRCPHSALHVERIDKDLLGHPSRVIATVNASISAADIPVLLRAFERHLKHVVDAKLQLYLEPEKDRNRIRRL